MLVRQIKSVDIENRLFRGEVLDRVEVSAQVQRLLLQDCKGDCIYVILQGTHWQKRGKTLRRGDKVQLGPFKPRPVPSEFASFFAPKQLGNYVADIYIEFTPEDFEFDIVIDSPDTKSYTSLSQCLEAAHDQVPGRFNVAGIVLDYVQDDKLQETMVKCKLTDDTLEPGEFLQVHMFIKNSAQLPKVRAAGDILALHGITLKEFNGKAQGCYNNWSEGFAVFSLESLERISGQLSLQIKGSDSKVSRLSDWAIGALQTRSVLTGRPLKNLGSLKSFYLENVDCVCFVVKILECYPEEGSTTLVLCDSTGYVCFEAPSCQISEVKQDTWIKLRDVKAWPQILKTTKHTALLTVPEYCYDVQSHISSTLPGLSAMKAQALSVYEEIFVNSEKMQTKLVTYTTLEKAPLFSLSEVVNTCVTREFCRFKCLLVDFQPRSLEEWYGRPQVGLMYVWATSEIIEVIVSSRSAKDLLGLETSTLEAAEAKLSHLMSGSNWLEVGLRRKMWKGQVLLELFKTFAL